MTTKTCRTCQLPKSVTEFYRNDTMRDGFMSDCKRCKLADSAKRKALRAAKSGFTPEQTAEILRLHGLGKTQLEIAGFFSTTRREIYSVLKAAGVLIGKKPAAVKPIEGKHDLRWCHSLAATYLSRPLRASA